MEVTICCLLKPDLRQVAYVVVSADTDVYDLTEIVKVKLLDGLVHVDASRLEVWKPNYPAVSKEKKVDQMEKIIEIIVRAGFSENNDVVELLDSAQNVMSLNLKDGFLIVRVPPPLQMSGITSFLLFH